MRDRISPAPAEQGDAGEPTTLADVADRAYKAAVASHDAGRGTVEDIYRWSRRLMEAQQADGKHPNAKAEHLARMVELHGRVGALHRAAVARGGSEENYYATKSYALEAEADKPK